MIIQKAVAEQAMTYESVVRFVIDRQWKNLDMLCADCMYLGLNELGQQVKGLIEALEAVHRNVPSNDRLAGKLLDSDMVLR